MYVPYAAALHSRFNLGSYLCRQTVGQEALARVMAIVNAAGGYTTLTMANLVSISSDWACHIHALFSTMLSCV